ncbi:tellurite resistance/C4-dicarboxylate transporter family protein [Cryobacterium tepidiphilum]|uniref:Tellurite resistance protein permease n=1 Tax=Cryobacterium tepidiphilum TaxID=2486026 RepID=A0A3M8KTW4_9MICO|nr:tellurite resistance/C4-dicarboxylate transporter family protein [Cryobacterium tepidiphilum]RNE56757.1 tellurite resistance protein permease [Cryobacterium tepidiphilum]
MVIRRLPAGSFAFVMASGIVSTALAVVGWTVPSTVLLVISVIALVVLGALTVARVVLRRADVMEEARNPGRAFGFFTIVAALNVVGLRVYSPDAPGITIALAVLSVPLWLLCSYGVPANLMLRPRTDPVASDIDGSWFLWVVGTQSLATVTAVFAADPGNEELAAPAVALWGIGVLLYLMLATLVTLRLLTVPSRPDNFNPSYWIYMGATAITVLAGSTIVVLPADIPVVRATASVVSGLTYLLWAFGVWWVPLLVIFGLWRHVVHKVRMRYEAGLWSIVFPLGMYSVASTHFGLAAHLPLLVTIGEIDAGVAGVAWLAAAVAMVAAGVGRLRHGAPGRMVS